MVSTWLYLRPSPHRPLNQQIFLSLVEKRGLRACLVDAMQLQGVSYLAVQRDADVTALICPLDMSREYGKHLIGYQAIEETALPGDAPESWCRASAGFLATLSDTSSPNAFAWRTRCVEYQSANGRLGKVKAQSLFRLEIPYQTDDGLRCRLIRVLDARKNIACIEDHPQKTTLHMTRHQLVAHRALPVDAATAENIIAAWKAEEGNSNGITLHSPRG